MWATLVVAALLLAPSLAKTTGEQAQGDLSFTALFGNMLAGSSTAHLLPNSRYGGSTCAGCAIVLTLVDSDALYRDTTIEDALDKLCKRLPAIVREPCEDFVNEYGATIIQLLEARVTPDGVCLAIKLCGDNSPGPKCHIMPVPPDPEREERLVAAARERQEVKSEDFRRRKALLRGKRESPWQWLLKLINRVANQHLPLTDFDNDTFSTEMGLRGYAWRGKDCDDFDSKTRPGTAFNPSQDMNKDWNCNGIFGQNPTTGNAYEQDLCASSQPLGVVQLGDSAAAHFHIPPSYMNVTEWGDNTFDNVVDILMNELDWPQMSSTTGWQNSTWAGAPPSKPLGSYSVYQQLLERNRCQHRDYQSMSVNGARVGSMSGGIIQSFQRNQRTDIPALVFYALIGNDVCNGHPGTSHMTPPAQFKASVLQSLDYLDTVLPSGSHVVTGGLAKGSLLYEYMHARIHPLGAVNQAITYTTVYDYLNCLEISPCYGWMNSNATMRNITDAWAASLSAVYPQIIQQYGSSGGRWKHFDLYYFPSNFTQLIQQWSAVGGQPYQLIEPIDGFHPAQIGDTLQAINNVQALDSLGVLPPINPNNKFIQELFGDQGGY